MTMSDKIHLRSVLQTDGTFKVVDQDGRELSLIHTAKRVWEVGCARQLEIRFYEADETGNANAVPDGWSESLEHRDKLALER